MAVLLSILMALAMAGPAFAETVPAYLTQEATSIDVTISDRLWIEGTASSNDATVQTTDGSSLKVTNNLGSVGIKVTGIQAVQQADADYNDYELLSYDADFKAYAADSRKYAMAYGGNDIFAGQELDDTIAANGFKEYPLAGKMTASTNAITRDDEKLARHVVLNIGMDVYQEPDPYLGGDYAILEDDGTLIFFRSENDYSSYRYFDTYKTCSVTDIDGNNYYGQLFCDIETHDFYDSNVDWLHENLPIFTVDFAQKIRPISTSTWFYNLDTLTTIKNIKNLDTSNTHNMEAMFYDCPSLKSLDLSSFDTSNVTDMGYMFNGCTGLESLDLSSFDTSNVTDMSYMFFYCTSLESLDLSSFDTSNVTDMSYMFFYCTSLESLDLSNFNTSKVTNMNGMFDYVNCPIIIPKTNGNGIPNTTTRMYGADEDTYVDAPYNDNGEQIEFILAS